ncbi:MAG: TIGR02757 family protein [Clostridium sp.]|nr:TIGR02757 family protein [Prevotella sp.]MCM1429358.1 TIGR02757 family protein [Clostridium sp.]MCM1475607.1 TIGR02757 family protein [Muribaculaceae bacterium]
MSTWIDKIDKDIIELLDTEARRINKPEFIDNDPVQFPRRYSKLQDIEITSVLAATLAWGNRRMICRDIDRLLTLMDHQPFSYLMERGYEDLDPTLNIHRTFFARNLQHYLRGLRRIYSDFGSLNEFCKSVGASQSETPAWTLVENMLKVLSEENGGVADSRCLPVNLKVSALKRINMALRWLVRDDGIVDLGVWDSLDKSQLYIPLDIHVGNTSRNLGILTRKANDRKSVEQLTATLRILRPDDPVFYDYALFGIGIGE